MSTTKDFFEKIIFESITDIKKADFFNIDTPIKKGEIIVGEMTNREKSIRTLWEKKVDEINKFHSEKNRKNTSQKEALMHKILHHQVEILDDLFWMSIRDRLPKAKEADSIGIRKDYKIVSFEEESLFGGIGIIIEIASRK